LYINFHFIPPFTSVFPLSLLFAISSDQKLAKIRSKVDIENERCFKRKNGFGVIHNWLIRMWGWSKEDRICHSSGGEGLI
jgi:hypothetical protein